MKKNENILFEHDDKIVQNSFRNFIDANMYKKKVIHYKNYHQFLLLYEKSVSGIRSANKNVKNDLAVICILKKTV